MSAHPTVIRPRDHAVFSSGGMGKSTIVHLAAPTRGRQRVRAGPGPRAARARGMDKVYYVLGARRVPARRRRLPMRAGDLLVAPDGVPHGVRNTGSERLSVLAMLAPGPAAKT